MTLVRWKDNKVVTVASTLYGKEPMKRTRRYIKGKGGRVEIDQPNSISVCSKTMGGVDRMDHHARFRSNKTLPLIFPAPRSTQRVIPEIRHDGIDHWIAKGNLRRCAKCSKTSKYFCEKCNVGLHPDCFKDFHIR